MNSTSNTNEDYFTSETLNNIRNKLVTPTTTENNNIAGIDNEVTKFSTGAVRDIQENKGRCDLLPLSTIGSLINQYKSNCSEISKLSEGDMILNIFDCIHNYVYTGLPYNLQEAICLFVLHSSTWADIDINNRIYYAILDVSKHFKNGTEKYGERNWEKGIPLHSYIDSGVRHLLKCLANITDERHDLAFIWNMLCCIHTQKYIACMDKEELKDLPYYKNLTHRES